MKFGTVNARKHLGNNPYRTFGKYTYSPQYAVLPCGTLVVDTGENKYWDPVADQSTVEVWRDLDGKVFGVCTSGLKPLNKIGDLGNFVHDQTFRKLRGTSQMIGWFHLDPKGKMDGSFPETVRIPIYCYK